MNSTIGVTGAKGQPLSIDVSVGLRTSTDLRSLMLDAAYALPPTISFPPRSICMQFSTKFG